MTTRQTWRQLLQDDICLASLLAAAAGVADAIGYVGSGVFAANMTGNTVLASLSLAQGQFGVAAERGMTLGAFFLGAMLGSLILRVARRRSAVPIFIEAGLIFASAFLEASAYASILLIAAAMGIQATALTRFRQASASTVVITSTMARCAEYCLAFLVDRREARALAPKIAPAVLAATWVSYAAGAMIAVLARQVMAKPLFVAALLLVAVALIALLREAKD